MRRTSRMVGTIALAAMLGACAANSTQEFEAEEEPSEGGDMDAAALAASQAAVQLALNDGPAVGEEVYEAVCSACHSLNPPMKLAPPLMMVMRHYSDEYGEPKAVAEAIDAWLRAPDASRSGMPAHAIERFGLMPPLPLSPEQRTAIAAYLVQEYDQQGSMQGEGHGQMQQRGGRGMHGPDTTG